MASAPTQVICISIAWMYAFGKLIWHATEAYEKVRRLMSRRNPPAWEIVSSQTWATAVMLS